MITSLHIRNFKCFESLELPLGPLTMLAGINGSGKSSVIQSLLLLRQSLSIGAPSRLPLILNGELIQLGTFQDALYGYANEPRGEFMLKAASGDSLNFPFKEADGRPDIREPADPDSPPSKLLAFNLFGEMFQYLNAERIGPRTSFPMSDYAVRRIRSVGSRGEFTSHFLAVYGDEKIKTKELAHPDAEEGGSLRDQVEAWLDFICPGTRLKTTPFPGMDVVQLQYQFTAGRDLTNDFRPTNVGFGLTYTLPILVAVLASKPGALIILENPEAHLHPHGQARMGEFLAKAAGAGIQIIIETHSDHILNGIRLAVRDAQIRPSEVQLHFFRREIVSDPSLGEKPIHTCISPKLDKNGRMDQRPDGFFDEWDKSLRRMLGPVATKSPPGE